MLNQNIVNYQIKNKIIYIIFDKIRKTIADFVFYSYLSKYFIKWKS